MKLRFLTSGESHGPALVAILEGMPAGLFLSVDDINRELKRRQKGFGSGPRMKIEKDSVDIIAGVMEGKTTGAPLAMLIKNRDHKKWIGKPVAPFTVPRPGHADLTGAVKYGYNDLRPSLERASARETAARVAVGAICKQLLDLFEVSVGGYVISIGEVNSTLDGIPIAERVGIAESNNVRCPDPEAAKKMGERIRQVMKDRDTLGGVIEVIALGVPPGLGSHVHWDRRLDARLGAAVLSVQAIKGVEIGPAFENTRRQGTQTQDPIQIKGKELIRSTNRAGGLEGGITNGNPLVIRAAMKPIATTLISQQTVDLFSEMEVPSQYERSDYCPVPRAVPIIEAMVAYVIADALLEKLGGDSIGEIQERFTQLRRTNLSDLRMDGEEHIYWPLEE